MASPAHRPQESGTPGSVPRVETAQLSLMSVMSRFPDDLRKLVLKMPPQDAMVILPLPTIQKMLPTGSVKMSLASVVRQAPPGTFATINPQDKRQVEVPLAEIFKRISPALLKKRPDQKLTELAAEGFDIFGDTENPHTLAPRVEGATVEAPPATAAPTLGAPPGKVLKVQPGVVTAPPPTVPVPAVAKATPASPASLPKPGRLAKAPDAAPQVATAEAAPAATPAVAPAPVSSDGQPPLVIGLKEISGSWPEPIKSEAAANNGATVSLPAADVSSGLAKGKVAFAWGQIRAWMNPPPTKPSEGADATELVLPLRVIAPAFLKHTKGGGSAKKAGEVGDIPELFAGGKTRKPKTVPKPEPAPEATAPEPAAAPTAPEPVVEAKAPAAAEAPKPEAPDAPEPAPEAPIAEPATPEAKVEAPALEPAAEAPAPTPAAEVKPEPAPAAAALPQSVGEFFGQPDKAAWSPTEVVNRLAEMPDFVGAVVALQEGLVIAHKLPEPLKGEIFAAFLPQIFARLNQYSGEMKLGSIDEVVVQTEAGPCHLFRRGQVLFAAVAKPGASIPPQSLRLCADAVAS